MTEPFVLRPCTDDDLNFIRATWLEAYVDSDWRDAMAEAYWPDHLALRDKLIARGHVLIVGLESSPTAICGWACTEPARVHFVYVKERWRKLGIAKKLLEAFAELPAVSYTHRTRICKRLPLPETWTYHPYEAFA